LATKENRGMSKLAAFTTMSCVELETPPDAAVICGLPIATPVAFPELSVVASVASEELHVAVAVKSPVLPSLYFPVAVNCSVPPTEINGF
jgi:hypothetical protein